MQILRASALAGFRQCQPYRNSSRPLFQTDILDIARFRSKERPRKQLVEEARQLDKAIERADSVLLLTHQYPMMMPGSRNWR